MTATDQIRGILEESAPKSTPTLSYTTDQVPPEIAECARRIAKHATMNGWEEWELIGVADRRIANKLRATRAALLIAVEALEKYIGVETLSVPEGWDYPGMGGGPDADQLVKEDIGVTAEEALNRILERLKT